MPVSAIQAKYQAISELAKKIQRTTTYKEEDMAASRYPFCQLDSLS